MRSNNQNTRQIQQLTEKVSPLMKAAKRFLTLGLKPVQWLSCFLICAMLVPVFSLPVGASAGYSTLYENEQFEPVNEQLPVWTKTWRNLNAKIEAWITPIRNEGLFNDDKNDEKKNKAGKREKAKGEREAKIEPAPRNAGEESKTEEKNEKINETTEKKIKKKGSREKSAAEENSGSAAKEALRNGAAEPNKPPAAARMLFNQANRPVLSVNELPTLVSPTNNLGSPLGQTESSAPVQPSALLTRERAGIGNFGFGLPLVSLPGRQLDASVNISYNSQLWTKTGNQYVYNVDGNWLAPGFQTGFGYLDAYRDGVSAPTTFILTGGDGTRRQLDYISGTAGVYSAFLFESNDGGFTRAEFGLCGNACSEPYNALLSNLRVTYSDGTKVFFSGGNPQNRYFPTKIIDRHGNYINITYLANDEVGKISTITDTLGRVITFHYDSSEKLIAVSVPGYNNSSTPRQVIRFYYESITLQTQNRFDGTIEAPASISALKYVYFPGTKTGYRYDYSSYYGMIYKITQLHGMQVTTDSTSQMGSVIDTSGAYLEGAWTRYNYPGTDIEPPASTLTDPPKYNKRTDSWIGRPGTSDPQTFYSVTEDTTTRTTQITTPDNTTSVTVMHKKPGQWDDGLIKETYTTSPARTAPWRKTIYTWQQGQITRGRRNPRIEKLEVINDAGQAKATTFTYDLYNNQTQVKEHDFAPSGQTGTELRRTEISYQLAGEYTGRNLIHLPASTKTVVSNTIVSRTDYQYDGIEMTRYGADAVIQHEPSYNPDTPDGEYCYEVCPSECQDPVFPHVCHCEKKTVCDPVPVFDSTTLWRGNVTKITRFVDPYNNNDSNASVDMMKYDIAGNVVEATSSCCQKTTWEYTSATKYAYPTKLTKGIDIQLITTSTYDLNTGLRLTAKDENNQETTYEHEPDTLRQKKVTSPNGGYTLTEYSDKLITTTANLLPKFARTTTTLDSSNTVQNYSYFDGRGLRIRSAIQTPDGWSVSAVEYDQMVRVRKSYNPFYATTPTGAIPQNTKFTEITEIDALGRQISVKLQDDTTVSNEYSTQATTPSGFTKPFVTVTDQAGKKRRQVADALGRNVRLDEPNASGQLGAVDAPYQPTLYEYDGNDNLTKVTQSDGTTTPAQERVFKYDALSRLTHERQVEANPTLDISGVKGTSDPAKWTKVLKYNTDSLLVEQIDARGVKTSITYDALNRLKTVAYTGETGYQTPTATYSYDQDRTGYFNKGKLTKIETAAATDIPATAAEFDFDQMSKMVKHRQSIGSQNYNLEYAYSLAGHLISEKYPSGRIVTSGYDANGRLSQVSDASRTYLNNLQYQQHGGALSAATYGNGTIQTLTLNDRLQMTRQELKRGTEVLQKYDYGYGQIDSNGNLDLTKNSGQLAKIESYIGAAKQWTKKFSYDSIGRLGKEEEFRGDTSALVYRHNFDYDRFGNLYRKQANNPNSLSADWIEDSHISKVTNRLASNTIYDDAGNVTKDTKFRGRDYKYDANGRMTWTKLADNTGLDATSIYDASGNRVAEKVNGAWRFLIYDAFGKLVAEYGGISASDEGGVKYALQDWQGSTRAVLNAAGFILSRADYQAFGEEIASSIGQRTAAQGFGNATNLRQKYGLTERDEASGLDHTWWRKNEIKAGRWTSGDPYNGSMKLSNPQSFNRYSYVENQPTNYVDPSGLLVIICTTYWTYFWKNTPDGPVATYTERTECYSLGGGVNGLPQGGDPHTGGMPIDVGGGIAVAPATACSPAAQDECPYRDYAACQQAENNICHLEGKAKFEDVVLEKTVTGGAAGAVIGEFFVGPVGAIVGGVIGGAAGLRQAARAGEAVEKLCKANIPRKCASCKPK